jgi:hypothetical protein
VDSSLSQIKIAVTDSETLIFAQLSVLRGQNASSSSLLPTIHKALSVIPSPTLLSCAHTMTSAVLEIKFVQRRGGE